jgi:hypothetical protein
MPCYVNIALGNFFGHAFLFLRGGTALCFFILPLKIIQLKIKKQCAVSVPVQKA